MTDLSANLELIERRHGRVARSRLERAFIEVSRWVLQEGHGNFTGSCVNHTVGAKLKFETFRALEEDRAESSD